MSCSLGIFLICVIFIAQIYCGEEKEYKYKTYKEMSDFLHEKQKAHKDVVEHFIIGQSTEGRLIHGLKINKGKSIKPAIIIDAGIHAREWVAPAVVLHTINQLLDNSSYVELIDKLNWYIIPLLNPDGYVYSMESSVGRLWRKNRARTFDPLCDGVDLNRNFGFYWGGAGSSENPCHFNYRGPFPFSEPEVSSFANFFLSKAREIQMYLTFHSAAQAILYPWGYDNLVPPDWEELDNLAKKAALEINRINGTKYVVGATTNLVGVGAGGSDDWAKGSVGVKYVYTFELPGSQYPQYGFDPPESVLSTISRDAFRGIQVFAEHLYKNNNSTNNHSTPTQ